MYIFTSINKRTGNFYEAQMMQYCPKMFSFTHRMAYLETTQCTEPVLDLNEPLSEAKMFLENMAEINGLG
jgi:hypothetical protein